MGPQVDVGHGAFFLSPGAAITQGLLRTRPETTGTKFCSRSQRPTPVVPGDCRLLPALRPTVPEGTQGQFPHSAPTDKAWSRGDNAMTPKQACPQPQGLGHNLRSKTQWFTRFYNSHQVSHFTTFFIDARAEISIAESRLIDSEESRTHWASLRTPRGPPLPSSLFLSADRTELRSIAHRCDVGGAKRGTHSRIRNHPSFYMCSLNNDPSAGSPTETLLRLLLPLNDKVQWTSQDVVSSKPPTSPRSEHFTGPFNR
ncbi:hypothetical protein ZIOFF_068353 [Zingiber officinale]|uniref:Uncharacterized protein n=1 Tax=Zingiber officinale TaxID=94328 RepID=A0A8J5BLL5_ZINOF|nr:hypothetical protein ZIOFF_068353 [Zingiber officinale]